MSDEFRYKAVVVDIDGTLADRGERDPYDWFRVGLDKPVEPICRLVRLFSDWGFNVITVSGRMESCRPQTEGWMDIHDIPSDELWMRPDGDFTPDDDLKHRIYLECIEPRYRVEYVIDDRAKVVKMWREKLGLTVLQVAEGGF